MTYTPTKWVNGGKPAINAENLNKIEEALARLSTPDITTTTSTTQPNSFKGREHILEIGGVMEQDSTTGANLINQLCVPITYLEVKKYFLKAGTYTASRDASENGNNWYIGAYDNSDNVITASAVVVQDYVLNSTNEYKYGGASYRYMTFTINVDCYVKIGSLNGSGKTYLMLNKGSTVLPYEPYTGGIPAPNPSYPQEIKKSVVKGIKTHGNNFFDITTLEPRSVGQGGTVSFNGDIANISSANQSWAVCRSVLKVKAGNSYVFKFKISNYSATTGTYIEFNCNGKPVKNQWFTKDGYYEVLVIPTDNILELTICSNGTANKVENTFTISEAQLEEGDVATEYQRFQESSAILSQPIDLYGKDGVQDIFNPQKIGRKYKKVVFDGSGYTVNVGEYGGGKRFRIISILKDKPISQSGAFLNLICTHFMVNGVVLTENNIDNCCCGYSKDENLYIRADHFTTVEVFNAFFAQNPMTVVYELTEETTEALPIADQIALNSLPTYDGTTYVVFDSEVKPTLKAEYGTSKVGGYTLEGLLAGRNGELKN